MRISSDKNNIIHASIWLNKNFDNKITLQVSHFGFWELHRMHFNQKFVPFDSDLLFNYLLKD